MTLEGLSSPFLCPPDLLPITHNRKKGSPCILFFVAKLAAKIIAYKLPQTLKKRQFKSEVQQVLMMTARILHSECDSQAIFLVDY
jgi:hypothetical protein